MRVTTSNALRVGASGPQLQHLHLPLVSSPCPLHVPGDMEGDDSSCSTGVTECPSSYHLGLDTQGVLSIKLYGLYAKCPRYLVLYAKCPCIVRTSAASRNCLLSLLPYMVVGIPSTHSSFTRVQHNHRLCKVKSGNQLRIILNQTTRIL